MRFIDYIRLVDTEQVRGVGRGSICIANKCSKWSGLLRLEGVGSNVASSDSYKTDIISNKT